jgi:hypothetical protein
VPEMRSPLMLWKSGRAAFWSFCANPEHRSLCPKQTTCPAADLYYADWFRRRRSGLSGVAGYERMALSK